jgi:hypothetical protein
MKKVIMSLVFVLVCFFGTAQFDYNAIYKSDSKDGKSNYFRIYNDGLIVMVTTTDDLSSVKNYFNRENNDVVVSKAQSNIKEGIRASFTIEIDGQKFNCIAVINGETVSITRMGPGATKTVEDFKLVK